MKKQRGRNFPVNFATERPRANASGLGAATHAAGCHGARKGPPIALRLGSRVRERIFRRTLWAVERLIPESGDVEGAASGRLSVAQIAGACGASRSDVRRSLAFLRRWRVLWLRYEDAGVFEMRFQRRIVKGFVLAAAVAPGELAAFLDGHRRKREAAAPWRAKGAHVASAPPA